MLDKPSPESTLVIMLGASSFPKAPTLFAPSEAFKRSADGVKSYFLSTEGFRLPKRNLLNLFNSPMSSSNLDAKIAEFLKKLTGNSGAAKSGARDVIVYYVGHGGFSDRHQYCLAIRDSREENDYFTSYPIDMLAKTLKEHARHLRRYLILDCCFSAAAYNAFQSSPLRLAIEKTLEQFPEKGTALLCAAGRKDPVKVPPDQQCTMFSEGLIEVLTKGSPSDHEWLSLEDVCESVWTRIKRCKGAVKPETRSPEKQDGDLAKIPLFPNAALRMRNATGVIRRFEAELASVRQTQKRLESLYSELAGQLHRLEERITDTTPKDVVTEKQLEKKLLDTMEKINIYIDQKIEITETKTAGVKNTLEERIAGAKDSLKAQIKGVKDTLKTQIEGVEKRLGDLLSQKR